MSPEDLLDSWKAVSLYLGYSVRTCQRLEQEAGLPIHRLDGSSKARIFAYAQEIDGWLEKSSHPRQRPFWRRATPWALGAAAVLILAFTLAYLAGGFRSIPASVPVPAGSTATAQESPGPFLEEARAAERAYVTECDPKDLDRAIKLYEQAIVARPGSATARFGLGGCYQNDYLFNGRKEASFAAMSAAYQEALRLAPDLPEAHLGIGWLRLLSGNRDEAYGWFVKAHGLAPSSPWVNYQLGVFLGHIGLVEKAIAYISRAIDLGERSTRAYRMRAHFEVLAGQFRNAAADAARLCEMNPTNAKMFSIRALAKAMQNDLDDAAADLEIARTLDAEDPYVGLTDAFLAAVRKERRKALESMDKVAAKASVPPHLAAQVYALLGMGEEAVATLRRGVESDRRLFHRVAVPYSFLANTQKSAFDQLRSHPGFRAILAELMAEHDELLKRYSGL